MWSEFDESIYQEMIKDFETNGDKIVNFNGTIGRLSLLIEATKMVRNMAGYKN